MAKKDFAAMEAGRPSGESSARAALRSRMAHPSRVGLDEVQANPDNPRYSDDDPEVQELADSLKRVGQLQPALVVSREQYLRAYPERAAKLGPQRWVVIVGNRRLVACRLAGRTTLDVRVAAELESPDDFEDRILIENIHRKDLPPLLEAEVLQRRLQRPGQSLRTVAEAIGKTHVYVKQRVDLLGMIPEFKELFVRGQITIKTARQLGALPEAEQRSLHAAGPPYTPTPRQQGNGHAGGNPVTTPSATASGNGTGESREAPPGNRGIDQAEQEASSSTPAEPTTAGGSRRSSTTKEDGRRKPAELDLDAARSAVRQWLDNALTELDRALPSSADGAIGQSLTEARRHIEAARAALVATPSE